MSVAAWEVAEGRITVCKFARWVVMLAGEWKIIIYIVFLVPTHQQESCPLIFNFRVCVCVCVCVWQCLKGLMAEEIREYNVASGEGESSAADKKRIRTSPSVHLNHH